jgi:hypothetical protein
MKTEYMNPKSRFILWNENSTNVDEQPAVIIRGGRGFKVRLKEALKMVYDSEIKLNEFYNYHKVPSSFIIDFEVIDHDYEESLALLKAYEL